MPIPWHRLVDHPCLRRQPPVSERRIVSTAAFQPRMLTPGLPFSNGTSAVAHVGNAFGAVLSDAATGVIGR